MAKTQALIDPSEDHPPSFYCPISCQVMHDPVVLEDGHTYERRHISKWLETKNMSPVTGSPLASRQMFPNHAMRNAIFEYFQKVFRLHRQAIRNAAVEPRSSESTCFESNAALVKCVDALIKASVLVNGDLSTESVLRRIVDEARELVGAEVASLFLVDHANQHLFSTINSTGGEIRIPIGSGIAGHVATSGEALVIPDAYADPRFNQAVDKKTGFKTDSILCVPIKTKKGTVLGIAQVINRCLGGVAEKAGSGTTLEAISPTAANCSQSSSALPPPPSEGGASFTSDDARFFSVFASQAAATLVASGLCPEPEDAARPSQGAVGTEGMPSSGHRDKLDAEAKVGSGEVVPAVESTSETTKSGTSPTAQTTLSFQSTAQPSELHQPACLLVPPAPPLPPPNPTAAPSGGVAQRDPRPPPPPPLSPPSSRPPPRHESVGAEEECVSVFGGKEQRARLLDEAEARRSELTSLLETASRGFECDVLRLSELTHNAPLSTLGSFLFERSGVAAEFGLDRTKLHAFLRRVEQGYSDENPYHNKAHAASVLHMAHALMVHGGVAQAVGRGQWFCEWRGDTAAAAAAAAGSGGDSDGETATPSSSSPFPPAPSAPHFITSTVAAAASSTSSPLHPPGPSGSSAACSPATPQSSAVAPPRRGGRRSIGALETLAVLLAAACHDFEHSGVTNPFLVKTRAPRAVRYNDLHPNENHHAAASFAILLLDEEEEGSSGCDVLSHLGAREFAQLRQLFVDLVLGTDMADDKAIVESVTAAVRRHEDDCDHGSAAWGGKWRRGHEGSGDVGDHDGGGGGGYTLRAFSTGAFPTAPQEEEEEEAAAATATASSGSSSSSSGMFEPWSKGEAVAALQLALKAADVGHLALPWESHVAWVRRLESEFFAQGDREKELGLVPVSFLMDRDKPGVSETQCGFFQFVVVPLFSALERAFPMSSPMVAAVDRNHEHWIAAAEKTARAAAAAAEVEEEG